MNTTPDTDDFMTPAPVGPMRGAGSPVEIPGAGGTGGQTTTPERFTIDSEKAASWLLSKLRAIEDEKAAIEEATRQRLDELTADYKKPSRERMRYLLEAPIHRDLVEQYRAALAQGDLLA